MKRDRQRERRIRARHRAVVRTLPPQHLCPQCGSRMGRWNGDIAPGQKAKCGNGHVWIAHEPDRKSA